MGRLGLLTFATIFLASSALAHGGGIDRCGGHNNRKTGQYHVHHGWKYCACHPEAERCAPREQEPDEPQEEAESSDPG